MNKNSSKSLFNFNSKNNISSGEKVNYFKSPNNISSNSVQKNLSGSSSSFNIQKISLKLILFSLLIIVIICIVIYVIICAVHYNNIECYEKKTFYDYFFDFSNNEVCIKETKPEPVVSLPPEKKIMSISTFEKKKEVFHISNQDYSYAQGKCKCESYGGRLATKAELTDAYNNGANWCTYGWTDKQSAFYPVQKCEWDKISVKNERLPDNQKKYCGMPGINGGYFANPEIKFGVNCYGIKPEGKLNKEKAPYCPPMNFCKLEHNFEASHKLDTDDIVGFNDEQWSASM